MCIRWGGEGGRGAQALQPKSKLLKFRSTVECHSSLAIAMTMSYDDEMDLIPLLFPSSSEEHVVMVDTPSPSEESDARSRKVARSSIAVVGIQTDCEEPDAPSGKIARSSIACVGTQTDCEELERALPLCIWFGTEEETQGTLLSRLPLSKENALNGALSATLRLCNSAAACDSAFLNTFYEQVYESQIALPIEFHAVPCCGKLARRMPVILRGGQDCACIGYGALGSHTSSLAGAVLDRCVRQVRHLSTQGVTVFKIGITATPLLRCVEHKRDKFEHFVLLHISDQWCLIQMLEAALIHEFSGASTRCQNEPLTGGDGGMHTQQPPFFAYLTYNRLH